MLKRVKRTMLYAWIACLALLFSALAPSMSHALAYAGAEAGTIRIEVCTADGNKTIVIDSSGARTVVPDSVQHHLEHCPYCSTHAGSFALPPPAMALFAVLGGHDVFPYLFYNAPARLYTWSSANPRAPPALA
ncbi:MAG: DUF2946 domain-containing protein [Pseudomonadota bacterium]